MPVTEPGSTPRWMKGTPLMTRRGRVVVLASACLVSATLALVELRPAPQQDSPMADDKPQLASVQQAAHKAPEKAPAPRPAVRRAAATARPASAATTLPVPAKSDMTTVVTARAPRQDEAAVAASMVTVTGCLEQDDERFQLKDTAGEDAPKGRSWRSGFLRKSASTIDVVDQSSRLHLPTYVGQRVRMTGALVDREMQVRSVSIIAESCQEKSA